MDCLKDSRIADLYICMQSFRIANQNARKIPKSPIRNFFSFSNLISSLAKFHFIRKIYGLSERF